MGGPFFNQIVDVLLCIGQRCFSTNQIGDIGNDQDDGVRISLGVEPFHPERFLIEPYLLAEGNAGGAF